MDRVIAVLKIIGLALGIPILIGFAIRTSDVAPNNALVFTVKETSRFYPATSDYKRFMSYYGYEFEISTLKEAENNKFIMDEDARDRGYFIGEEYSLTGALLAKIGLWPRHRSRWNKDGSWN